MDMTDVKGPTAGDKAIVIMQSLLCLLRSKNVLSRADIEELAIMVESRINGHDADSLPCKMEGVVAAAAEIAEIKEYIGRRYGGKHRRAE